MACKRGLALALCLLALTACSPGATADPLKPPLTAVANIQLPKETGKPAFDLLTLDSRNERLYVAHSSVGILEVIDLHTRTLAGRVAGLAEIKGIALTADPNVVMTSQAAGSVAVVDVVALKVLKELGVGGSPDAIEYDPIHDVVVVGLSTDKKVAFIDAKTQTVLGTMSLPGSPELLTVDPKTGTIYLAIHDMNEVVVIDTPSRSLPTTSKRCE